MNSSIEQKSKNKPLQVSYYKATEKKNKKRVWMQGLKLEASGFTHETAYHTEYNIDTGMISLVVNSKGDRNVSGRKKNGKVCAIVEIFNSTVLEVFGKANKVRADFYDGRIDISIHHHENKQKEREERLKQNLKKGVIKRGSLCTGIGMTAMAEKQGLEEAGVMSTLEWIVDREAKYLQVAHDNNQAVTNDTSIIEASLEELEPDLLSPVDYVQFSLAC